MEQEELNEIFNKVAADLGITEPEEEESKIKCSNPNCENPAIFTVIRTNKSYCGECTSKVLKECVMCGKPAAFIAKETKEPLCENCNNINNQIRREKGLPPYLKVLIKRVEELK